MDKLKPLLKYLTGVSLAIVLVIVGLIIIKYVSEPNISVKDLKITNLSDTSVTVTWLTEEPSVGMVLVSENNSFDILSNFSKAKFYDDRDSENYSWILTNATPRYTHHVTVTNLEPTNLYNFRISSGLKEFPTDITTFETLNTLDVLKTPDPSYGNFPDSINSDLLVLYKLSDSTQFQSTYVNDSLGFSFDKSNVRNSEGNDYQEYIEGDPIYITVVNKEGKIDFVRAVGDDQPMTTLGGSDEKKLEGEQSKSVKLNTSFVSKVNAQYQGCTCSKACPSNGGCIEVTCEGKTQSINGGESGCPSPKVETCGAGYTYNSTLKKCDRGNTGSGAVEAGSEQNDKDDKTSSVLKEAPSDKKDTSKTDGKVITKRVITPTTGNITPPDCNKEEKLMPDDKVKTCCQSKGGVFDACSNGRAYCDGTQTTMDNRWYIDCRQEVPVADSKEKALADAGCVEGKKFVTTMQGGMNIAKTKEVICVYEEKVRGDRSNSASNNEPKCIDGKIRRIEAYEDSNNKKPIFVERECIVVREEESPSKPTTTNNNVNTPQSNTVGRVVKGPCEAIKRDSDGKIEYKRKVTTDNQGTPIETQEDCTPDKINTTQPVNSTNSTNNEEYNQLVNRMANEVVNVLVPNNSVTVPISPTTQPTNTPTPTPTGSPTPTPTDAPKNNGGENPSFRNDLFYALINKVNAQMVLGTSDGETAKVKVNEAGVYQIKEVKGYEVLKNEVRLASPKTEDQLEIQFFEDTNKDGIKQFDERYISENLEVKLEKKSDLQTFSLVSGWNLLGMSFSSSEYVKASDILAEILRQGGYATHITTYRNGSWLMYSLKNGNSYGKDFNIVPTEAYFVRVFTPAVVYFEGKKIDKGTQYYLSTGWNLMSLSPLAGNKASSVIDSINKVKTLSSDVVTKYENGKYENLVKEEKTLYGNDFTINSSSGYFVRLKKGGSIWTAN